MSKINPLLSSRWSPRSFAEREPELMILKQLLEAARWAPSCYNAQPWSFILGRRSSGAGYQRILDTLVPFNQQWAATAPVLLLGVASEQFPHNGEPNRHGWYDLGLAMGNLLVEATAVGVAVHQMAGFDPAAAAAACEVPAGHSVVCAAALGYPGEADRLPAEIEEKDPLTRERKPLGEFVFEGRWGEGLGDS